MSQTIGLWWPRICPDCDIAQMYSLRWLVVVFIQDWKAYGGWNPPTKQQGVKGSERGLILSLLCDHLLLQHPAQSVRLKNKQPGMPVGCLIERLKVETLVDTVRDVVAANESAEALEELTVALQESLSTRYELCTYESNAPTLKTAESSISFLGFERRIKFLHKASV